MVVLKNIVRNIQKNTIEADYHPEGEEEFGHIVVDMTDGEIISVTEKDGIPWRSGSAGHARSTLHKLSKLESLPNTKTVYWY